MKERILTLSRKLFFHELIQGSSIIFLGSMIGNVLSFFFNLFLVRNLSYAQYGEFAALLSLLTLAAIPAQSLQPVLVRFASQYFAKKEVGKAEAFYRSSFIFVFLVAIFFIVGFILFNPLLKNFFHITNLFAFFLVGLIVALSYVTIPNTTFLQSLLKFPFLAATSVLGGTIKLVVGIGLVTFGLGIIGGLWALLLSLLLPFLITFIPLMHVFKAKEEKQPVQWEEILTYAALAGISLFALSSFTSTDVLLVKHFFPSTSAGLYAGLSLVGRVIFYFTAPITSVMFPLVVKRYEKKEDFRSLLSVALFLVLVASTSITVFYFMFPSLTTIIFLGGKGYMTIGPYLGWYGIFLTLFSLSNVLVSFFLSVKKTSVVYFVSFGAVLQAILIFLFHSSFSMIILISLIVTLGLLFMLLLYYYRLYGSKKI